MAGQAELAGALKAHLEAVKLLAIKPGQFFQEVAPLPSYQAQALFVLPQVLVYVGGQAALSARPLVTGLLAAAGSYAGIALWTVVLRYTLRFFGERRSFFEVAHIATCSTLPLVLGWIPLAGAPLLCFGVGFYTYQGLTGAFKMNQGAAMAAVALPVVVSGLVGVLFSFVFLWLASLSTIFAP